MGQRGRHRKMKRWAFRISLVLLLGVNTTVGIAWYFGGTRDWHRAITYFDLSAPDADSRLWVRKGRGVGQTRLGGVSGGFGWGAVSVGDLDRVIPPDPSKEELGGAPYWHVHGRSAQDFDEFAFGWPLLALRCAIYEPIVADEVGPRHEFEPEGMIVVNRQTWMNPGQPGSGGVTVSRPRRFLPLEVIWSGFLGNTVFYASAWFGLFAACPRIWRLVTREKYRIDQGRCPKCDYNLRGEMQYGCSECGWNRE